MTLGSLSICVIVTLPGEGYRHRSVVTEPARQPIISIKSAFSIKRRVSGTPPLLPTTPTAKGWSSGIDPFPLTVVATGISSCSAKRIKAPSAPAMTTPPPQRITGFLAARITCAIFSTAIGSGPAGQAGYRPRPSSCQMSVGSTEPFCTSNGRARWADPGRPVVISRKAVRSILGTSSERSMTPFHFVRGRNNANWSSSVRAYLPREPMPISVVMAKMGTELSFASTKPGAM